MATVGMDMKSRHDMLRATDFRRVGLDNIDVKLLFIDASIECECDKIAIVYSIEDVDKVISRMNRGDVFLWILCNRHTFMLFNRVLDDDDLNHLMDIDATSPIKKMYRIELMASGYNVVELKLDE